MVAAVLTDLSKPFDCLPYDLLLSKFYHYRVNECACKLVANYFMDRYHRVKLRCVKSDWIKLSKGAPQGSIIGPFAYNVHCNDLIATLRDYFFARYLIMPMIILSHVMVKLFPRLKRKQKLLSVKC